MSNLGYSGCKIDDRGTHILKISGGSYSARRLEGQALKQQRFYDSAPSYIKIPKIFDCYRSGVDQQTISMEKIEGVPAVQYLCGCPENSVRRVIGRLLRFIRWEYSRASFREVPNSVFLDKFDSINELANIPEWWSAGYRKILENLLPPVPYELLCGPCHGDLTLSNILIDCQENIYLIDFLDSYVESPVLDLVKLRQDTKFGWTGHLLNLKEISPETHIRYKTVMYFFDLRIRRHFPVYPALEFLNLYRILPYTKNERDTDFVLNALETFKE